MMGIQSFFKGVFTFIKVLIVIVVVVLILVASFKPPPFKVGPFDINVQVHFAPCLIDITINGSSKCDNKDNAPGGSVPSMNMKTFSATPVSQATPSLSLLSGVSPHRKINADLPIVV